MSRIDDALRRLTGAMSESRTPSVLERFASEGKSKIDDMKKVARADEHKVASFAAPGPHAVQPHVVHSHAVGPKVMATVPPPKPPEPSGDRSADSDGDGEGMGDTRQLVDYGGFVLHAIGRHKVLAAGAFVATLSLVVTVAMVMPKTYHVQVKLFAQRNAVMTALSNPGRAVPWDADAPTRAAAETVLRRDNVISLIAQTDLINEWDRTRAPLGKFKDWLTAVILRREPTPDEKLDTLVGMIEARMLVTAGPVGDGTVTIELWWPDAEVAYRLVEKAQQAFLDARQIAETTAITESIGILERYSASLHDNINQTISELETTQSRGGSGARATRAPAAATPRPSVAALASTAAALIGQSRSSGLEPDPELNRLKVQVTAKRQEVSRLEEARQRQMSELQQKLAALKTVYTADHPSVISLQQNMAAFQYESPQIVGLKRELEELEADYDELSAADAQRMIQTELGRRATGPAAEAVPQPQLMITTPIPQTATRASQRDEVSEFTGLRLRTELNQLQSILERTDGARIELAVSQAAFKYRYSVIKPAEVPREPVAPNLQLILLAGLVASLLLAVGLAVGRDLMSDRILEPWQVERQLGVPILGTATI